MTTLASIIARPKLGFSHLAGRCIEPSVAAADTSVIVIASTAALRRNLETALSDHFNVRAFATTKAYLGMGLFEPLSCFVVEDGTDLSDLSYLNLGHTDENWKPIIVIGTRHDVLSAVSAMKAGAADFLEHPVDPTALIASVEATLGQLRIAAERDAQDAGSTARLALLTPRQHQILELILAGCPSKIIAADLGISQRTVENHRAEIMKKTGSRSIPALVQQTYGAHSRSLRTSTWMKLNTSSVLEQATTIRAN